MTDIQIGFLALWSYLLGLLLGYILWAPCTPFKKGFIEALSFKIFSKNKE